MKILFQSDNPFSLNPKTDSTILLMDFAISQGWSVGWYEASQLSLMNGLPSAPLHSYPQQGNVDWELANADVIFIRQDPPYDMSYITALHFLNLMPPQIKILNSPSALLNYTEKLVWTFDPTLAEFTPPTLITQSVSQARDFASTFNKIIMKPLYGFASHDVFATHSADPNFTNIFYAMQKMHPNLPLICQEFIPEIAEGDKRILIIHGQVIGAFNRVQKQNLTGSAMRVGADVELYKLTNHDYEIANAVASVLLDKEIYIAGIDIVGHYLTEINITSPAGLRQVTDLTGVNIAQTIFDGI